MAGGGGVVAKAWVQIIPEMSGIQGEISQQLGGVSKASSSAGKASGSGFASGFKGAVGALGTIVAAVGFADLVSQAAEATDATQKFKSTLSFAGLGTSEIDALAESTRAYADQTVYSLSDIQGITAQLAANGVPNYDRLAEAAGNLNAVAGGNADTFKSVGMVLTQTAGQGKLTTENWNQLADAIPGASGKLQEALKANGAYTGNFREAMEKGEITADEFNRAIMDLGFTDAAQEAAKSTSTFEGAMGNLQATVVGGLSDVLAQLQPVITGALNGVAPVLGAALSGVSSVIGGLVSAVTTYGPQLAGFFSPVVTAAQNLWTTVQPLLSQLGGAFAGLLSSLGPVLQSIGGYLSSWWTTLMNIASVIASTVLPIVTQVVNFVTTQIMPVVVPAIQSILQTIQMAFPIIQSVITIAMGAVQAVWNAVWPALQAVVMPIVQGISAFIQGAMTVIQGIITVVLSIINGNWSAVWGAISGVASAIWGAITGVISGAVGAVQGAISGALGAIQGVWNSIWSSVSSFVSSTWESVKGAVSSGVEGVVGFIGGLPGRIMGFFADAGSWLIDSGRAILDGLIEGITAGFEAAADAVSGGLEYIRGFLPFSPAKRGPFSGHGYTTYSGEAMMADWGRGIDAGVPAAVDYAAEAAGRVRDALAGVAGASPASRAASVEGAVGGPVVNQTFNTRVVRADEDMYAVAPVVYRNAQREARMMGAW